MSDNQPGNRLKVRAQGPEILTDLQLSKAKDFAGGVPAIVSSLKHLSREMGVLQGLKTMSRVNQEDGLDCPSCAWPDPDDRSKLGEYCENGVKAISEEGSKQVVDASFFKQHCILDLSQWSDFEIGKSGRLTEPLYLAEDAMRYVSISWDDAVEMISSELRSMNSPDEAVFYASGRTSNEAAFMYQLFARMLGTNNLPDCSNMCHESSGMGMSEVIGVGKGTVSLKDFEKAEVIMVIGQNPGTNHPRMLSSLEKAKRSGASIVHINPLREAGLQRFKNPQNLKGWIGKGEALSDLFVQVKINGDVALLKGIMKGLVEAESGGAEKAINRSFIDLKTTGFDAFLEDIDAESWATIEMQSGVARADILAVVDLLLDRDKLIVCWAMGLTQHENAIGNIQSIVNLLLMKGALGRPGAGACPVRGHSNVQGDRTVGITPRPKSDFLDNLARHFEFNPPREIGLDTVQAIEAMHKGKVRVFFSLGGNFISATPDTELTAEAMRKTDLSVQVSTKLNRSHLVTGRRALILPCLGRTEEDLQDGKTQFVSVENSMGIVHKSEGMRTPASSSLRSEVWIIAQLARTYLAEKSTIAWMDWANNYDLVRSGIEACIPGFSDFNSRVRSPGGFLLPNIVREGGFGTSNKKGHFTIHAIPDQKLEADEFIMMTIRSHDQFNTTIYGLEDRYRGIKGERRIVMMNPKDMDRARVKTKTVVDIFSYFSGKERVAHRFYVVPYDIPEGCVATYFPEANVLVPIDQRARKSNTPASKSVVVKIRHRP